MAKRRGSPARYRITWEFELLNPRDYAFVKGVVQRFFEECRDNSASDIHHDYLACEKVHDIPPQE